MGAFQARASSVAISIGMRHNVGLEVFYDLAITPAPFIYKLSKGQKYQYPGSEQIHSRPVIS